MIKKLLIGVGLVLALLLIVISTRPPHLRVERSTTIPATPELVFPLVNDFRAWASWSPWERLDPSMKRDYSGPTQGVGAVYSWSGNDDVGSGRMTITESRPPELVKILLEFTEPFEATNTTTFALSRDPQGTRVAWAMESEQGFMSKAMSLFMDMDQMIGKDFEQGLDNMRNAAAMRASNPAVQAVP